VTTKDTASGSQCSSSQIADQQLDALEHGTYVRLYNALVDTCESILDDPGRARERSVVILRKEGMRFRAPLPGSFPHKVFWSLTDRFARMEAAFPYGAQATRQRHLDRGTSTPEQLGPTRSPRTSSATRCPPTSPRPIAGPASGRMPRSSS